MPEIALSEGPAREEPERAHELRERAALAREHDARCAASTTRARAAAGAAASSHARQTSARNPSRRRALVEQLVAARCRSSRRRCPRRAPRGPPARIDRGDARGRAYAALADAPLLRRGPAPSAMGSPARSRTRRSPRAPPPTRPRSAGSPVPRAYPAGSLPAAPAPPGERGHARGRAPRSAAADAAADEPRRAGDEDVHARSRRCLREDLRRDVRAGHVRHEVHEREQRPRRARRSRAPTPPSRSGRSGAARAACSMRSRSRAKSASDGEPSGGPATARSQRKCAGPKRARSGRSRSARPPARAWASASSSIAAEERDDPDELVAERRPDRDRARRGRGP